MSPRNDARGARARIRVPKSMVNDIRDLRCPRLLYSCPAVLQLDGGPPILHRHTSRCVDNLGGNVVKRIQHRARLWLAALPLAVIASVHGQSAPPVDPAWPRAAVADPTKV